MWKAQPDLTTKFFSADINYTSISKIDIYKGYFAMDEYNRNSIP